MMEYSLVTDPIFDDPTVDFNEEAYKERIQEARAEHIYDIIVPLRSFLGFAPLRRLRTSIVPLLYRRRPMKGFLDDEDFKSEWYEEELDARTKLAYMIYYKKLCFFPDLKLYLNKEDDQTFQASLGNRYQYPDYLTNKDDYLFKELIAVRYEYARSQLKPEVLHERDKRDIHELLLDRARSEVVAIGVFTLFISEAAYTLQDNPIMVDSGQYKEGVSG